MPFTKNGIEVRNITTPDLRTYSGCGNTKLWACAAYLNIKPTKFGNQCRWTNPDAERIADLIAQGGPPKPTSAAA